KGGGTAVRPTKLSLERAGAEVHFEPPPRQLVTQPLDEPEANGGRAFAIENYVDVRPLGRRQPTRLSQQSDHALHTHGEADGRRGLASQLRDQAIVTTAGAHGILRTRGLVEPLENRPGVVIQTAHQTWVDLVLHANVAQHTA